jgi:UPF0042 nucleotide-binding protein
MSRLSIVSFGYRHGAPPKADLVTDLRLYRNPYVLPWVWHQTARDRAVVAAVLGTPGYEAALTRLVAAANLHAKDNGACDSNTDPATAGSAQMVYAIGSTNGRHRSVVAAIDLAERLKRTRLGLAVTVSHRDLDKPGRPRPLRGSTSPTQETDTRGDAGDAGDAAAVFAHCRTATGLISDGAARTIASWWADGPLGERFTFTGAVEAGLWDELADAGAVAPLVELVSPDHGDAVLKLRDYVVHHAGRGPVAGWSEVWVR